MSGPEAEEKFMSPAMRLIKLGEGVLPINNLLSWWIFWPLLFREFYPVPVAIMF